MNIAFYGSSLLSSYWNGAATYYRGLIQALAHRGHHCSFFEPRAFDRQRKADIEPPPWCNVCVYEATPEGVLRAASDVETFDVVIKTSGVGVFDDVLPGLLFPFRRPGALAVYLDVDAPATLASLASAPEQPLRNWVRELDYVFIYGGGENAAERYRELGAKRCTLIYNGLDPEQHFPEPARGELAASLSFMGNRLPDREARVDDFFISAARRRPDDDFLLGGSGWESKELPFNIRDFGHVPTALHNAWNSSARMVLNISREAMAKSGFAPATRVFEAAGAGACIVTDSWDGVDAFFKPGCEILVARDGKDVAECVARVSEEEAAQIGAAARARCLCEHTYEQRAAEFERCLLSALDAQEAA